MSCKAPIKKPSLLRKLEMKKVFVTGADGMLGSCICRELIEQGFSVKAMCHPSSKTNTIDTLAIEIVRGDVTHKPTLSKEMEGCDMVIHVAAVMKLWPRRHKHMTSINVLGTKNVMEVAESLNMERMIHIGTASSFANGTLQQPGNEKSAFIGHKFRMDYIDSKYKAQQMLLNQYKNSSFPVIIINPTFMIGPFDSGPSSGQMLIAIFNNSLKFYNQGGKNFVCTVDVAKATVNALSKGKIGECYIAGNENLSYIEFFQKAFKSMHKPFNMKGIPNFVLLMAGFMSSAKARIDRKTPKLSYGIAQLAKENQYFSAAKAVQELNMPQTPIEIGIAQCLQWFKDHKYI